MNELHEFLVRCLAAHREWIIATQDGRSFAITNSEIELDPSRGRLLVGFPIDSGYETWRVSVAETYRNELRLELARDLGRDKSKIRLIPRASFAELQNSVETARLEQANRIAARLRTSLEGIRLIRVELTRENGRLAQITFEQFRRTRVAIADVTSSLPPEFLLSSACFLLSKLGRRKRNPVTSAIIIAESKSAKRLSKLHALLRSEWFSKVSVAEFEDDGDLVELQPLELGDLWKGTVPAVRLPSIGEPSETARSLIEMAPDEIDSVFSRQGESIRFRGLAFARVRRLFGIERAWFGIEHPRRPLSPANVCDLETLISQFREFRTHDSPNRRHLLYDSAPEAWLESILRRDIRKLDANLVLSPVYHQFRAERDKIDLLALRRDGRLVIIELKVEPDREMVFQTVDYWRKIERIRRSGRLAEARLFGDLRIADAPAICYLVAPTLAFHRDFDFSASLVSRQVEIHRFNLAEDWRKRLRVLERRRVT